MLGARPLRAPARPWAGHDSSTCWTEAFDSGWQRFPLRFPSPDDKPTCGFYRDFSSTTSLCLLLFAVLPADSALKPGLPKGSSAPTSDNRVWFSGPCAVFPLGAGEQLEDRPMPSQSVFVGPRLVLAHELDEWTEQPLLLFWGFAVARLPRSAPAVCHARLHPGIEEAQFRAAGQGHIHEVAVTVAGQVQLLVWRETTTRTAPWHCSRTPPRAVSRGTTAAQSHGRSPSERAASLSRRGISRVPQCTRCPP
jgi:hypothetical protein